LPGRSSDNRKTATRIRGEVKNALIPRPETAIHQIGGYCEENLKTGIEITSGIGGNDTIEKRRGPILYLA